MYNPAIKKQSLAQLYPKSLYGLKSKERRTPMTERELRRLSRTDLLELLLAQRRENEQLRCLLDQTQAQLADRTIKINHAGSIAEASLQLNGVFEAAQASCQHYVDNIKLLSGRQEAVCKQMEQETQERCNQMVAEAEQRAQQCWDNCSLKIKQLVDSFEGLSQIMELYSRVNGGMRRSDSSVDHATTSSIIGDVY